MSETPASRIHVRPTPHPLSGLADDILYHKTLGADGIEDFFHQLGEAQRLIANVFLENNAEDSYRRLLMRNITRLQNAIYQIAGNEYGPREKLLPLDNNEMTAVRNADTILDETVLLLEKEIERLTLYDPRETPEYQQARRELGNRLDRFQKKRLRALRDEITESGHKIAGWIGLVAESIKDPGSQPCEADSEHVRQKIRRLRNGLLLLQQESKDRGDRIPGSPA